MGNKASVPAEFKGAKPARDAESVDEKWEVQKDKDGNYKPGAFIPELKAFYITKDLEAKKDISITQLADKAHAMKYLSKGKGLPVVLESKKDEVIMLDKAEVKVVPVKPSMWECCSGAAAAVSDPSAAADKAADKAKNVKIDYVKASRTNEDKTLSVYAKVTADQKELIANLLNKA